MELDELLIGLRGRTSYAMQEAIDRAKTEDAEVLICVVAAICHELAAIQVSVENIA